MAAEKNVRTVNIFLGFFFVVNFCLGTGFLGVPYAFFYTGTLLALFTLILISIISWTNANYLLEVMARAQVSLPCMRGTLSLALHTWIYIAKY